MNPLSVVPPASRSRMLSTLDLGECRSHHPAGDTHPGMLAACPGNLSASRAPFRRGGQPPACYSPPQAESAGRGVYRK